MLTDDKKAIARYEKIIGRELTNDERKMFGFAFSSAVGSIMSKFELKEKGEK